MLSEKIELGDVVQMKKVHPCGSKLWRVVRTGADIKIRCLGCDRLVMMDRADFMKRVSKWISHENTENEGK